MRFFVAVITVLLPLTQAWAVDLDALWELPQVQGAISSQAEKGSFLFALDPVETSQEVLEAKYFGENRDADYNVFLGKESARETKVIRDGNLFLGEIVNDSALMNHYRGMFSNEILEEVSPTTNYFMGGEISQDSPVNLFMP